MLLARLTGAKRILEIGTLGGYSTMWLGRGTMTDKELSRRLRCAGGAGGIASHNDSSSDEGGVNDSVGKVMSLEINDEFAAVAVKNWARIGFSDVCEVTVGAAADSLRALASGEHGSGIKCEPFDMVFIDADKTSYSEYMELAIPLMRPGGLLIADNIVRGGAVIDPPSDDENAIGANAFNRKLAADHRVESVGI